MADLTVVMTVSWWAVKRVVKMDGMSAGKWAVATVVMLVETRDDEKVGLMAVYWAVETVVKSGICWAGATVAMMAVLMVVTTAALMVAMMADL